MPVMCKHTHAGKTIPAAHEKSDRTSNLEYASMAIGYMYPNLKKYTKATTNVHA